MDSKQVKSIDEMKAELERIQWDNVIVRNGFMSAAVRGLSEEEKWILIAYHAVISSSKLTEQLIEVLSITPRHIMLTCENSQMTILPPER